MNVTLTTATPVNNINDDGNNKEQNKRVKMNLVCLQIRMLDFYRKALFSYFVIFTIIFRKK